MASSIAKYSDKIVPSRLAAANQDADQDVVRASPVLIEWAAS